MRKRGAVTGLVLFFSGAANATVWTITGGNLTTWFTDGVNGGGLQNIYEGGFGSSSQYPGPRSNGYNCTGVHATHTLLNDDVHCGDNDGTGPDTSLPEEWGTAAAYSGTIDMNDGVSAEKIEDGPVSSSTS